MVIDIHTHPGFLQDVCTDPKRVAFRREHFYLLKQSIWPLALFIKQLDSAKIDKAVLLAEDLTTTAGDTIVSNEEVKSLVDKMPDRFIGFASVDPNRDDALEVLEHAFKDLGLLGLKLNPSSQKFYPTDAVMKPIYELCIKYDRPILFHAGMSFEANAPVKYSQPMQFEDIAIQYPNLRICLGHFGWPWVMDTAMLLLKYPNVYADTALLFFDSPKQFFKQTFSNQIGEYWIDRTLADKVMFGSNYPRIEQKRMKDAVESLTMRDSTLKKVLGTNAQRFIGLKG
jgi:uncharacterized protein